MPFFKLDLFSLFRNVDQFQVGRECKVPLADFKVYTFKCYHWLGEQFYDRHGCDFWCFNWVVIVFDSLVPFLSVV